MGVGTKFLVVRRRVGRYWHALRGWLRGIEMLLAGPAPRGKVRVCYGHARLPGSAERAHGGIIKVQRMQELLPSSPRNFNILYLVSSQLPADAVRLAWFSRRKGAHLVWNQNGVAYPGWHGPGWETTNAPMRALLRRADYVFYQSEFCKLSADRYLGSREDACEVLYNAVDTSVFTPGEPVGLAGLILLLAGTQYRFDRVATALETLAHVARERSDVQLLVAGRIAWAGEEHEALRMARSVAQERGVEDRVTFLGPFSQQDAPSIFRRAHLLLHTKYNDPCPGIVIEAMACGLPVVYSASGGVPELVGPDAGIGTPAELSWEREIPPDPALLAEAVLLIAEQRRRYAEAARQRAVDRFDLGPWLERHRTVFEELVR